jgi:cell division protein FtsW
LTRALKHYDPILLLLTLLVTGLGLFFIFDAGYARSLALGYGPLPPEFRGQAMFLLPAAVAGFFASRISGERWFKLSKVVWIVSLLLLIAVEVAGKELNGAKRWLALGPINIQPAEFAKLATVIYLAGCFANRPTWPEERWRFPNFWLYLDNVILPKVKRALPALWVLIAFVLIEIEPDLGTGAVVAATAYAMFFPGGVSKKSILVATALAIAGAGLMVWKQPYRMDRVTNHMHRWDARNLDDIGYQTVQSELAMANGGLLGVGVGAGRAKHVMPATTTDFVMATVGEEFGLFGALVVIGALGALVWRLLWLAYRTTSRFAMLVLYGVAAWIGIQTCVNVMMANGFLPAIGIPLPFISSGGSSLVALWMAIGVCQGVVLPEPAKGEVNETRRNGRRHRRARVPSAGSGQVRARARGGTGVPRIPTGPRS